MGGPWQSTPDPDRDLANCDRCGKPVVLDHDPPCPHGIATCDTCDPAAVCDACLTDAMNDDTTWMDADPLFNRLAHELRRTNWDLGEYDPGSNSYTRRKP